MQEASTRSKPLTTHVPRAAFAAVIASSLFLSGCTAQTTLLNSERIEARFGSYSVRVMYQDPRLRISSLESTGIDGPVTRTLAVVQYAENLAVELREPHHQVLSGASIGATFRDAGWSIRKPVVYIGDFELTADDTAIASLMNIPVPALLAVHVYDFTVARAGRQFRYARITELHHPQYLSESDLLAAFGAGIDKPSANLVLPPLRTLLLDNRSYLVR